MVKDKIISRNQVVNAKYFKVIQEEINLKTGENVTYHTVLRSPSVCIFPLTPSYELYLVSQYRKIYKKVTLESVGGFIDKKESSLKAAMRELKEEVGLSAENWEEIGRVEFGGSVIMENAHLFLATDLEEGKSNQDASENITIVKMALSEAVKKVLSREITECMTITGILMLDKLTQEKKI